MREASRGRYSGGLCVIYKNSLTLDLLNLTPWWIICRVNYNLGSLYLCSVYFKPNLDFEYALPLLQEALFEDAALDPQGPWIISGDFNSRVGNLGDVCPEVLEGSGLRPARSSLDGIINTRGRSLIDTMDLNGFLLLRS